MSRIIFHQGSLFLKSEGCLARRGDLQLQSLALGQTYRKKPEFRTPHWALSLQFLQHSKKKFKKNYSSLAQYIKYTFYPTLQLYRLWFSFHPKDLFSQVTQTPAYPGSCDQVNRLFRSPAWKACKADRRFLYAFIYPECKGTPCSKQAWYLKVKWL